MKNKLFLSVSILIVTIGCTRLPPVAGYYDHEEPELRHNVTIVYSPPIVEEFRIDWKPAKITVSGDSVGTVLPNNELKIRAEKGDTIHALFSCIAFIGGRESKTNYDKSCIIGIPNTVFMIP